MQRASQPKASLAYLRKRRRLADIHHKRLDALFNIEQIIGSIQSAETDAEIMEAYRSGSRALKEFMSSQGLTVDSAESAVTSMESVLADQQEIDQILSQPINAELKLGVEGEEEELEEELRNLQEETPVGSADESPYQCSNDGNLLKPANETEPLNELTVATSSKPQRTKPLNEAFRGACAVEAVYCSKTFRSERMRALCSSATDFAISLRLFHKSDCRRRTNMFCFDLAAPCVTFLLVDIHERDMSRCCTDLCVCRTCLVLSWR